MQEQNLNDLQQLMQYNKESEAETEDRIKQRQADQAAFHQIFEKLKKDIIWPKIVEIGNVLTGYGHDFHVAEENEYTDATAKYHPASIVFYLYPSTLKSEFKKPGSSPYIAFIANTYAKKISLNVSTMIPGEGGSVGSHGEYTPDQITPEMVEKEIIAVLKNTMMMGETEKKS